MTVQLNNVYELEVQDNKLTEIHGTTIKSTHRQHPGESCPCPCFQCAMMYSAYVALCGHAKHGSELQGQGCTAGLERRSSRTLLPTSAIWFRWRIQILDRIHINGDDLFLEQRSSCSTAGRRYSNWYTICFALFSRQTGRYKACAYEREKSVDIELSPQNSDAVGVRDTVIEMVEVYESY